MELNPKIQDALHSELAERLLAILRGGECKECGRSAATAKDLTVIRQFLADNGITASLRSRTPLHKLAERGAMPFAEPDEPVVTRTSKKTG